MSSTDHWHVPGKQAHSDEYQTGRFIVIEHAGARMAAVITETWIDGHGNKQCRWREATPDELLIFDDEQRLVVVMSDG